MKGCSFIVLFCAVLLSGCSTLSEQECRSADWYQLGSRDGNRGEQANLLEAHRDACKRYGIQPNDSQYRLGREDGLKQYCQLDNAFRLGSNGIEYTGVCAAEVDFDFRRYNSAALAVYRSKKKIEENDRQLAEKEHELGEKDTPEKEKIRLRTEIRDLDRARDRIRTDQLFQERELEILMGDVQHRSERR